MGSQRFGGLISLTVQINWLIELRVLVCLFSKGGSNDDSLNVALWQCLKDWAALIRIWYDEEYFCVNDVVLLPHNWSALLNGLFLCDCFAISQEKGITQNKNDCNTFMWYLYFTDLQSFAQYEKIMDDAIVVSSLLSQSYAHFVYKRFNNVPSSAAENSILPSWKKSCDKWIMEILERILSFIATLKWWCIRNTASVVLKRLPSRERVIEIHCLVAWWEM